MSNKLDLSGFCLKTAKTKKLIALKNDKTGVSDIAYELVEAVTFDGNLTEDECGQLIKAYKPTWHLHYSGRYATIVEGRRYYQPEGYKYKKETSVDPVPAVVEAPEPDKTTIPLYAHTNEKEIIPPEPKPEPKAKRRPMRRGPGRPKAGK